MVFLVYGGHDYGWYRVLLYPYLTIASAYLLVEGIKRFPVWVGMLFIITVFSSSLWWGTYGLDWKHQVVTFRIGILLLLGLLMLGLFKNSAVRFISTLTLICLIFLTFWLNLQTINKMQVIWPALGDKSSIYSDPSQ